MESLNKIINTIKNDKESKKQLYMITIVFILFMGVMIFKSFNVNGGYIVNKKNKVVGIYKNDLSKDEEYKLKLEVKNEAGKSSQNVTIFSAGAKPEKENNENSIKNDDEIKRNIEIRNIISEVEEAKNKKILLPGVLDDGSKLIWHKNDTKHNDNGVVIIGYFLIIAVVIVNSVNKKKSKNKDKSVEILKGLPRFTNQLLMLLNAGMILSDAFDRICSSYRIIPNDDIQFFESELICINERNRVENLSTAALVNRFAGKYNVKELMRIATVLTENEKKGSDIIDNLKNESQFLWENRKITAKEKGKMIDTKMAYPLGLLLIQLIIITMAPAMLAI